MVVTRTCKFIMEGGQPCRAATLQDGDFCLWHSPEHADEVAEARRLGGLRRRRERAVSGAYDFEGLNTVQQVRRLLEIAALDTVGLENSVARSRTLAYLAQVASTLGREQCVILNLSGRGDKDVEVAAAGLGVAGGGAP